MSDFLPNCLGSNVEQIKGDPLIAATNKMIIGGRIETLLGLNYLLYELEERRTDGGQRVGNNKLNTAFPLP